MATPTLQPPISPEQRLALEQQARYNRIVRNLAIGGVVLCPLIAFLPPRKLDLYTFSLGVGFYLSADHLCTAQTGRGLIANISPFKAIEALPTDRAREMQKMIREERDKGRRLAGNAEEKEERGILDRLWMGDEKEGWKERRLQEERQALEEGKGYLDIIIDQIWEVWNWDKKKNDEDAGKKED